MDKSRIAEWFLAKVSTKDRAAEVVGDLLEERGSPIAFWVSIFRIVFAMHWRWLIAVPAAMFSVLLALKPYLYFIVEPYVDRFVQTPHTPGIYGMSSMPASMQVGTYFVLTSMSLWTVAALVLCRHGIRSPLTRLTCVLNVLFTAGACCMNLPHAVIVVPALLMGSLAVVLAHATWRRLLVCILAAGVTFFAGLMGLAATVAFCVNHFSSFPAFGAFLALGGYVACIVAEAWVLTVVRRWALEPAVIY